MNLVSAAIVATSQLGALPVTVEAHILVTAGGTEAVLGVEDVPVGSRVVVGEHEAIGALLGHVDRVGVNTRRGIEGHCRRGSIGPSKTQSVRTHDVVGAHIIGLNEREVIIHIRAVEGHSQCVGAIVLHIQIDVVGRSPRTVIAVDFEAVLAIPGQVHVAGGPGIGAGLAVVSHLASLALSPDSTEQVLVIAHNVIDGRRHGTFHLVLHVDSVEVEGHCAGASHNAVATVVAASLLGCGIAAVDGIDLVTIVGANAVGAVENSPVGILAVGKDKLCRGLVGQRGGIRIDAVTLIDHSDTLIA